jgi:hypothetical protein
MGRRVVAARKAYDPAEVDLWSEEDDDLPGGVFETYEMVRSRARKFDELMAKAEAVDENDDDVGIDQLVELLADLFDVLLRPKGHRKLASKIIVERYQADKLSIPTIEDLVQEIAVAARPT